MIDYRTLVDGYRRVIPSYERLAQICEGLIHQRLLEAGLRHVTQVRTKDFASFLRKALHKGYADPLTQEHDLAGVRVVVPFFSARERVAAVVRQSFRVEHEEDTAARHKVDQFGYRGWHFEIRLRDEDLGSDNELAGRIAELQVHTRAESAWAEADHDLVYKPNVEPSKRVRRRFARLMALVELFDEQMTSAQAELLAMPDFAEATMLVSLERVFLPLAAREYDQLLSLEVLKIVRPSYEGDELERFDALIAQFARTNEEFLRTLYARYRDDKRRHVLLFQPEAIALLERIERAPMRLIDAWDAGLPAEMLDDLADALGAPIASYRGDMT